MQGDQQPLVHEAVENRTLGGLENRARGNQTHEHRACACWHGGTSGKGRRSRLLAHDLALEQPKLADGRRHGGRGQVRGSQGRCQIRARQLGDLASALLCASCSPCRGLGGRTRQCKCRADDRVPALGGQLERDDGSTMFETGLSLSTTRTWVSRVSGRWRMICRVAEECCC
jgi:hypothetical protein